MQETTLHESDIAIPLKDTVPLRTFPITVPILTFQFENLYRPLPEEDLTPEIPISDYYGVSFSETSALEILERMRQHRWSSLDWHLLAREAERISLLTPHEHQLIVLANLQDRWRRVGMIAYPHQIEAATKVIRDLDGRAILADEVGLGKTIEACMIIKEYMLRGMARRVLILTPASLCWQWYNELKDKFGILASIQRSQYDWERCEVIIASLDKAKRPPHCDIINSLTYDMLVIDEAHKLKNASTRNWQFVNGIRKKYFLMLTATPVQNDLKELYTLITLLKPGQLGTYAQFQRQFMEDKRVPRNASNLRELLSQVMVRNRRGVGTVEFTQRRVQSLRVSFSPPERRLYDALSRVIRDSVKQWGGLAQSVLSLITLQREVCSTPVAASMTLEKLLRKGTNGPFDQALQQLLSMATACQECSKADLLIDTIRSIGDKVIVFTEYRASQQYLRWRLEQHGFVTLGFDGSLSSSRKEWVRELFRRHGHVLVSTESGGEGLNFQFACHVINYDLPWNPMRLEQRIGRVHRLGQTRDVHVYNMATSDTIEEHILFLLYEKINMFNMVIGNLDTILSELSDSRGLESRLYHIVADTADDPERLREQLDALANEFTEAQEKVKKHTEKLDRWLTW